MSAFEFTSLPGKTFSIQLYNVTTGAPIGAAIVGVTAGAVPTLYRVNTAATGTVYMIATTINLQEAGFVDLDSPAANGHSSLRDALNGPLQVSVLPAQVQQNARSRSSTLKLYIGETITVSHQVLDANQSPVSLTGLTLLLVIEDTQKNVIASVTPTIVGSTFSAALPGSVTQKAGRPMIWALRNRGVGAGNAVVGEGAVEVQYAPGGTA